MTTKIYDTVIVGAGPGGLTAALYTSRANMSTLILDKGIYGGQLQNTDEIENFPGFANITGPELAQKMFEHGTKFGAEYKYGEVKSIKPAEYAHTPYFIVSTSKDEYHARSVIIATGTKYRKLGIPGEADFTGRGVSWCAVCDGAFYRNKHVVVIGGGDSAVEEAMYLTRFASKVTLIHRRHEYRAQPILVDRMRKNEKIEEMLLTKPVRIVGDQKVAGIVVDSEIWSGSYDGIKGARLLECDGVFEYVGMDPVSDFVKDLDITDKDGWILTSEKMETPISGLFAIGDVRKDVVRQVVTATGDGCVAAQMAQHYVEMLNN